jgi:hypothetical protein
MLWTLSSAGPGSCAGSFGGLGKARAGDDVRCAARRFVPMADRHRVGGRE